MKSKILLPLAIVFLAAATANAQVNKGRYLLGGSVAFNSVTNEENHSEYVNIQIGKVIKENTVIGIIGYIASNNYSSQGLKVSLYSAGVFYRKYKPLGSNFYFLWEIDGSFQHTSNTQTYFSNINQSLNTKSNGAAFNFIPGISYSVCKRLQMELTMPDIAGISYTSIKTIDSSLPPNVQSQKANNFLANVRLNTSLLSNFGIGFKFFLGK